MRFTKLAFVAAAVVLMGALPGSSLGADTPRDSKWTVLFDGKSTEAFRAYKGQGMPKGWTVEDGAIKAISGEGSDIITKEKFDNFELELEWKVAPGANSGVMYRVNEAHDAPFMTGPEMQVLDDDRHADGKNPKTSAGSLYALIAPQGKKLKPVGEWNTMRLVVKGNHAEHWLNGVKIVEYELNSPELNTLIAKSKFNEMPRFGKETIGHICLQHHGDDVWFRKLRIRRL